MPNNCINPKMVDLLDSYAALPEGVSAATIKLILFLEGNNSIKKEDFSKPDLDVNGCDGLQKPMQIAARRGAVSAVNFLINAGVTERPLSFLFNGIHESHLMGLNLLEIDRFKNV